MLSEGAVIHGYASLTGMYSLINMRQLHIFSIKPKLFLSFGLIEKNMELSPLSSCKTGKTVVLPIF